MLKRFLADWIKGAFFVVLVTHTTSLLISLIAIAAKWEVILRPYWFRHSRGLYG